MKWEKIRNAYPNQFVVYNILNEYQKDNSIIVTDISVIDVFNTLNEAYKYYCKLHKENKNRKVTIGDTRNLELIYNVERIGISRWYL